MYGKMNNKIDVYAYGVVLLELLSGRKPINSESPKARESLVMWVCGYIEEVTTLNGLSMLLLINRYAFTLAGETNSGRWRLFSVTGP